MVWYGYPMMLSGQKGEFAILGRGIEHGFHCVVKGDPATDGPCEVRGQDDVDVDLG